MERVSHFKRVLRQEAGFSLMELIAMMGGASVLLVLAVGITTDFNFQAQRSNERLDAEIEVLNFEKAVRRHFRQALQLTVGPAAGRSWIRPYNSATTTGLQTIALFYQEVAPNRTVSPTSQFQKTGIYFVPPDAASRRDGIFMIDHSTADPQPINSKAVFRRIVWLEISDLQSHDLGTGVNYVSGARFRAKFRFPTLIAKVEDPNCFQYTGCPATNAMVDSDLDIFVNFSNSLPSAPIADRDIVRSSLLYFFSRW